MSQSPNLRKLTTEKSARTINDAVLAALEELGVTKDDVNVEILEEGKSGFLGLFSKDATVRVTVKESVVNQMEKKPEKNDAPAPKRTEIKGEKRAPKKADKPEKKEEAPKPVKQPKLPPERRSAPKPPEKKADKPEQPKKPAELNPEQKEEAAKVFNRPEVRHPRKQEQPRKPERRPRPEPKEQAEPKPPTPKKISGIPPQEIAQKFLSDIFSAMQLDIEVSAQMESDDALLVNLSGDNMGIVIGKRGDTLDSLQYLTSLVINQQTEGYIKVTIDTENYREKRSEALLALSSRLAEKVAKTGKKFTLEPMNPYERRIIHSNLQDNEAVTTFSVGTEPYRKVVIAPKNQRPFNRKGSYRRGPRKPQKQEQIPAPAAEKKGSYTTTYKADFKPQQHKAEFKNFEDYLAAHEND